MATTRPAALHFTGDAEADALIASDPLALLIGFALDQQVPVQTAFSGPYKLRERVGTLDPQAIASIDPARLEEAFRQRPAIHRFPRSMAHRVQELSALVVERYGGDASRLWTEARDTGDLRRRIEELPGFGEMKVKALGSVLAKRFGVRAANGLVPGHPTLGDVDSAEALEWYQGQKRAHRSTRQQQARRA
jgi:uncharacterized HhH-GPD family protein